MLGLIAEMPWAHFIGETGWFAIVPPTSGSDDDQSRPRAAPVGLPLRVGARTVASLRRTLVRRRFSLAETLSPRLPSLDALPDEAHGYLVISLPVALLPKIRAAHPDLALFVRQLYPRCFTALGGSYDHWLEGLTARSRSTLNRKLRRFAKASGGQIDLRCYRRPGEMAEFHRHARSISVLTYQERLLNCGLPDGEAFVTRLEVQARQESVLGWILFLDDRPIAYLHAPADGDVLVYDHLGYDPAFANLSPGTVLQDGVMRQLFAEQKFRLFDFTEGAGRHKAFFASGQAECVDLLLLRRTWSNLLTGHLLKSFDSAVGLARHSAHRLGLHGLARRVKR